MSTRFSQISQEDAKFLPNGNVDLFYNYFYLPWYFFTKQKVVSGSLLFQQHPLLRQVASSIPSQPHSNRSPPLRSQLPSKNKTKRKEWCFRTLATVFHDIYHLHNFHDKPLSPTPQYLRKNCPQFLLGRL